MSETDTDYREFESSKTVVLAEDVHTVAKHISIDEDRSIKEVVDKLLREHVDVQRELSRRVEGNDEQ